MTERERQEILVELECAKLMVKDLEKVWKSYSKKAYQARIERERNSTNKLFHGCECEQELQDLYGFGEITEEVYCQGLEHFKEQKRPPILSTVEKHRANLKRLIASWKGSILELEQELDPVEKNPQLNAFEKLELEEKQERYKNMY